MLHVMMNYCMWAESKKPQKAADREEEVGYFSGWHTCYDVLNRGREIKRHFAGSSCLLSGAGQSHYPCDLVLFADDRGDSEFSCFIGIN